MNLHHLGKVLNALVRLSPKLAGRLALRLFISPRRIPFGAATADYLAGGEQLHLAWREPLRGYGFAPTSDAGTPARVLLVHGWESHAGRWVPLIRRLRAAGCAVVAFDGPAAGRSGGKKTPFNAYVDAMRAVDAAHGPFDALVGHSLGGGVVAQLLHRLPPERRPARAVVMAGFDESDHVFDRYQAMLSFDARVRAAFDENIVAQLSGRPGEATIRDYSNTDALAARGDVAGLVVHARNDEVSPYCEGVALQEAWPGSRLYTCEDGGHGLTGEAVLEAVADFVRPNA